MGLRRCRQVADRRQGRDEGKMRGGRWMVLWQSLRKRPSPHGMPRIRFTLSAHGIFPPAIEIERHEDSRR